MRILRSLFITGVLFALGLPVVAQSTYILTVSPANTQTVVTNHALTIIKELYDGANCVYLVSSASSDVNGVETEVESDLMVAGFEVDQTATLPELSSLTQPVLMQSNTSILDSGFADFGHGTMVAGVVHLIAPTARIMPLKAFRANGTSNLSDIV